MNSPKFTFSLDNATFAMIHLLAENNAVLNVILKNQIESISEKTGEPLEEVGKKMNETYKNFRDDKLIEIAAQWGS